MGYLKQASMVRHNIDINQPEFLPIEISILSRLIDKHEQYVYEGRDLEARGMARALHIMWSSLKTGFADTEPTEWANL